MSIGTASEDDCELEIELLTMEIENPRPFLDSGLVFSRIPQSLLTSKPYKFKNCITLIENFTTIQAESIKGNRINFFGRGTREINTIQIKFIGIIEHISIIFFNPKTLQKITSLGVSQIQEQYLLDGNKFPNLLVIGINPTLSGFIPVIEVSGTIQNSPIEEEFKIV